MLRKKRDGKKAIPKYKLERRLKKKLDIKWSRITKKVHGLICWWCGATDGLQSDHIANRWKHSTRWDVKNCAILCFKCHLFEKKRNPAEWARIVIDKIGRDAYDAILAKSRIIEPIDLEQVEKYLDSFEIEDGVFGRKVE